MRIEHLEISGFRGIPGVLSLKLGARLTVLYAPNGTGKTARPGDAGQEGAKDAMTS